MAKELEDSLEPGGGERESRDAAPRARAALALAALGIVYGDIGTSPLYALRECFHGRFAVAPSEANVLGVLSLILWSLVLVISVKYLLYVLRADSRGEGGILILMALLHPGEEDGNGSDRSGRGRRLLVGMGLFGATLLYADGTITPAISVLSAVEGLEVATSFFSPYVIPIAIGVLVALYAIQRRGTGGVGRVFGPIMLVWFATLALLGGAAVVSRPEVLGAVNPLHAVHFFAANGSAGYVVLGAVFLVVTGGEALYADIGHFGVGPIRRAWFAVVLPGLLLNYFGQGALLLEDPASAVNPFYRLAPGWAIYPLVVLATAATVIASQAVISGAFSLTRQAILLGYSPRMSIRHTSAEHLGQVFLPGVNLALAVVTIALVVAFGRSTNLAGAYGVAVSTTMVITTILAGWIAVERWGWPWTGVLALSVFFAVIDLAFLGANLTKLAAGGWFPIALAGLLFLLMSTWNRGVGDLARRSRERVDSLDQTLAALAEKPPQRVPGTAVFLTGTPGGTPAALRYQLEFNRVVHERAVVVTVRVVRTPTVPAGRRVVVEKLPLGFYRVELRCGFLQRPHVPELLASCADAGLEIDPGTCTYFVSREVAVPSSEIGMSKWRAWLFTLMLRNAQRTTNFFDLPHRRVVELGVEVEL